MSNVFFRPWVGSAYSTGGIFGKRVMILGESHYCEEGCEDCGNARVHPECCAFTNGVVSDYLNESLERQRWMSTYLKFERSLVGHETDWAERKNIWNSVVFYNYLQAAMGGPREAGTNRQYEEAAEPFFEVLEQYRPQYVIVWGSRLWGYMPAGERWSWNADIVVDGNINKCGNYALNDGTKVKIMPVNHPSVGYSWDYWHKVICKFLDLK